MVVPVKQLRNQAFTHQVLVVATGKIKTNVAKVQSQEFADAEGVVDKTKVALSNPSMISNAIGESLAPMAAGGLAGRSQCCK